MTELVDEQVTAELEGGFVVFRLGMRINRLWKVHRWLPILRAGRRLLSEVEASPDTGFLASDSRFGVRTLEIVQYWRSFEDLRSYALDPDFGHAPSMKRTMDRMEESDDVAIWHETYVVDEGSYETVYYNAPPTGLGKAGTLRSTEGRRRTAAGRLGLTDGEDFSYETRGEGAEPVEPEQRARRGGGRGRSPPRTS